MYNDAIALLQEEAAKHDTVDAAKADRLRRATELLKACDPGDGSTGDAALGHAAIAGATEFALNRAGIMNYNLTIIPTDSIGGDDGKLGEMVRRGFEPGQRGELHFVSFSKQKAELFTHNPDAAVSLSNRFTNFTYSIVAACSAQQALEQASRVEEEAPPEGSRIITDPHAACGSGCQG